MPQRRKEEVRARIVGAAADLVAEVGYAAATMQGVAARAETSIGNVYKYFADKEALLEAVLPKAFARDLERMTKARIEALGTARDVRDLPRGATYHVLAGELLDHCIAHRARIAILFGRAEGTPFASFAPSFAGRLVGWALDYAREAYPGFRPTSALRFTLTRVYLSFLASIGAAFTTFSKERDVREAVLHLTSHHQGGLNRLFEAAAPTMLGGK
ncbi:MAG: TetR/AcrR family transcriptional regulator [Deltaproteobacteria bacterium]|nr:TetR/AcrR family transcriptional regulator [Deltaproteobacteria bacterium]